MKKLLIVSSMFSVMFLLVGCNHKEAVEDEGQTMCCMAMTADCLACAEGVSVEEYCQENPETVGCEEEKTMGEQVDEAKTELSECKQNCESVDDAGQKEQCLAACDMADMYMDQVEEMIEDADMVDKTPTEMMQELQEMGADGLDEEEQARFEAMQNVMQE